MSDIESTDWSEIAANNIQPAPGGWPPNSSPNIVYSNGREDMGAIKRDWNRRNPTVTSGGSANAQTLTYTQGPVAYVQGQTYTFIVGFTNTSGVTLNVNGLGAKNIVFVVGQAFTGGELVAGAVVQVVYDGTRFIVIGASSGGAFLPLTGGTLTGPLTIALAAGPVNLSLNASAAGINRNISGLTAGLNRWAVQLGDLSGEAGSNAGSNFNIIRYNDAGTGIDSPLTINRASGLLSIVANTTGNGLALNGATGSYRILNFSTAGANRWQLITDNSGEGGSNAGSNFIFQASNDGGAFLASCWSAVRSTQIVSFAKTIVNGPSDRSLKENITPLEGSLDKVQQLRGVSFNFIRDDAKRRQIGLVAQDVAPIVPEVMQDFQDFDTEGKATEPKLAIDYTRLVPLLVEAIKELTAKVAKLEAGLAAASTA